MGVNSNVLAGEGFISEERQRLLLTLDLIGCMLRGSVNGPNNGNCLFDSMLECARFEGPYSNFAWNDGLALRSDFVGHGIQACPEIVSLIDSDIETSPFATLVEPGRFFPDGGLQIMASLVQRTIIEIRLGEPVIINVYCPDGIHRSWEDAFMSEKPFVVAASSTGHHFGAVHVEKIREAASEPPSLQSTRVPSSSFAFGAPDLILQPSKSMSPALSEEESGTDLIPMSCHTCGKQIANGKRFFQCDGDRCDTLFHNSDDCKPMCSKDGKRLCQKCEPLVRRNRKRD